MHKLNDAIVELGISEDLTKISRSCHPLSESEKYFYFDLGEDHKSLKLVRKKVYIPKVNSSYSDNDLPF